MAHLGRSAHLQGAVQLCGLSAPVMIWLSSIAISSRSKNGAKILTGQTPILHFSSKLEWSSRHDKGIQEF
jgi:hypothetical protein